MSEWDLCSVKCQDGKKPIIKGTEYLFQVYKLIKTKITTPNNTFNNNVIVSDNREEDPVINNTFVILTENKLIASVRGFLRNKTSNFEVYNGNVVSTKATHEVIFTRQSNIDSTCIFVIQDKLYNQTRKFEVQSCTVYEKDNTKLIATLQEIVTA